MKSSIITAITSLALLTTSCMENNSEKKATELQAIFPKGEKGAAENFTGNAWNIPLVANDSTYNTVIGNVILNQEQEAIGIPIHQVKY
jgi:hypothetical protein